MTLGITPVGSVLLANAVLGAVAVLAVYRLMETSVALGAVGGAGLGIGAIVAEWRIGETVFSLTVSEMKLLVVVAAVGAVVGVVGTLLSVEPDL